MRKNKICNTKRKRDVIFAVFVVFFMIIACSVNVLAVDPDESEEIHQTTEQEQTTEVNITEETQEFTELTTQVTTEATEETTEELTTEEESSETTEETTYSEQTENTTERNPWEFEVPTEGTVEAEQTKADYFTGTVMWSAVGGGLLILLIMFIGKRKS